MSLLGSAFGTEPAVRHGREILPYIVLRVRVEFCRDSRRFRAAIAIEDMAPGVDDHRIAVRFTAVVVEAGLGRRHHVAQILDGAGAQQRLPNGRARSAR